MNEAHAWRAVSKRDRSSDGAFVFAVTTTGIYCRPSCPARRPLRHHVRFFVTNLAAEREGFRACRRCSPAATDGLKVEVVRALCDELRRGKAPLEQLARKAGYSQAQVKRLFNEVLGLSPARFADACRAEALRHELRASDSVALAIYGAGYSTPSQVYGTSNRLGMELSAFAKGGAGVDISYAIGETSFGRMLLAATDRGVCSVEFGSDDEALRVSLRTAFPHAHISASNGTTLDRWFEALEAYLAQARAHPDLPLDVRTTAFRHRVYLALQAIPRGETRTYAQIASAIGAPRAARAVARACAENQLAVLIPCHRVLRGTGELAGYRWGLDRKRALLRAEGALG